MIPRGIGTKPHIMVVYTAVKKALYLAARWDHYSELMMLYLLAMAAPNPSFVIPASSWAAWA